MKESMSKKIACMVIIGSMLSSNVVYAKSAIQKDESVYVNLNQSGEVKDKTVSDWIHSDAANVKVEDKSILKDIKNIKGNETPQINGEQVVWNMKQNDIFYEGTTNEDLPIKLKVTYYLDGVETLPKDLAGKSGNVRINLKFENTSKQMTNINGKLRDIYTPMTTIALVTLPLDNFKNVKTSSGMVLSEGNNNIVNFVGFPGLKESLNVNNDDINNQLKDEVDITADAENFKLSTILVTSTPELPDIKSLKDSKNFDELKDGISDLKSYSNEIVQGALKLRDGLNKANSSVSKVKGKMNSNKDKLDLLRNDNKVKNERKIIKDAFIAKDMDTSLVSMGAQMLTLENLMLFNKTAKDFKNLDAKSIINNPAFKNLQAVLTPKFIENTTKLLNDTSDLSKIDINKLLPMMNLLNPQSISGINNLMNQANELAKLDMSKLDPMTGLLKNASQLSTLMNTAGSLAKVDSSKLDALKPLLNVSNANKINKLLTDASSLTSLNVDNMKDFLSTQSSSSKQFVQAASILNTEQNRTALKAAISTNQNLSDSQKLQLSSAIDGYYSLVEKTVDGMRTSSEALNSISENLDSLNNLKLEFKSNEQLVSAIKSALNEDNINAVNALLTQLATAQNNLNSKETQTLISGVQSALSTENIKNTTGMLGQLKTMQDTLKSSETQATIKGVQSTLSPENVAYLKVVLPKIMSMKSDLDDNANNLTTVKGLLTMTNDPSVGSVINKVSVLQQDIQKLSPTISKLQDAITPQNAVKLADSPKMVSQLLSMQKDLKDNVKILEVVQDSLRDGNVKQAKSLLNAIPTLTSGVQQLCSGSNTLYDGLVKFHNDGILKLDSKVTPKINDLDDIITVKDKLVELSNQYGTFTGVGNNMEGKVKFIMKTDEIKLPEIKKENTQVTKEEKKSFTEWLKNIF